MCTPCEPRRAGWKRPLPPWLSGHNKASRRLLKLITPVRKAAGKVRDMDVLIGDVLTLADSHGSESMVRLVEHLARMRVKHARKLHDVVEQQRPEARKQLKQSSKMLKKAVKKDWGDRSGEAAPQILISELGHWPDLNAGNLHMFRIRIKELRYMLELSDEADQTPDREFGQSQGRHWRMARLG